MTTANFAVDERATRLDFYPHHCTFETRSTDCSDHAGHIPNGRIAEFGDEGRLGLHQQIMGEVGDPSILLLVESHFRFLSELRFPGLVTVGVGLVAIGRSSIRQKAGFFRHDRCFVLANYSLVKAIDGASVAWTSDERRRAEAYLIPPREPV